MRIFTGVTGLEVSDQSLNPLLQVEDDETKSYSRLISVTRAATGGVVGAVLKNTAHTLALPGCSWTQTAPQALYGWKQQALEDALLTRPTKRSGCRIAPQERRRSWWKQTRT